MLFSIVLNSFNGEAWIDEAIRSVRGQDFGDWELIVWDDQSADGTRAIAERHAADDPRIRVFSSAERRNVAVARNAAMAQATGEWIAFIDQDDIWLPGKLRFQARLIADDAEGKLGIVYGRTRRFSDAGWRGSFDSWHGRNILPEGDIRHELMRMPSFIAFSSSCLRRSAVEALGPVPDYVVYCPDYWLLLNVARDWRAACVQTDVCLYRVHAGSMSDVFRRHIHEEVFTIIEQAALPAEKQLVEFRRKVRDALRAGADLAEGNLGAAFGQLKHPGVLSATAAIPFVRAKRAWRRSERGGFKYKVIETIRRMGLLTVSDRIKYVQHRVGTARRNRAFLAAHPEVAVPPAEIAFDAFNMIDWTLYHEGGRKHAEVFAGAMRRFLPGQKIDVLEWGCGPGRILRHMPELLGEQAGLFAGSDYNPETIAWCKEKLPGFEFVENGLMPPLPYPDASFDAIYSFSVLTHLSEEAQVAWMAELQRVLRPGGILLSTTHGENYRYLLTRTDEMRRYARGDVVTQASYVEGRKWYFAVHPPAFVQGALLDGMTDIELIETPPEAGMKQDLWVARKPVREFA